MICSDRKTCELMTLQATYYLFVRNKSFHLTQVAHPFINFVNGVLVLVDDTRRTRFVCTKKATNYVSRYVNHFFFRFPNWL